MISVGERGGNVDEMLLKTADVYEEEFTAGLTRAVTLMEPLLILAMGVVVGFIVLAILLPIFELNQIIR
jgi:general secretion pathway protein F